MLVVGRPREYLGEKYLLIETAKKINPLWAKARNLELKDFNLEERDDAKEDAKYYYSKYNDDPHPIYGEPVYKEEYLKDTENLNLIFCL